LKDNLLGGKQSNRWGWLDAYLCANGLLIGEGKSSGVRALENNEASDF
jgi:hypothetical protein